MLDLQEVAIVGAAGKMGSWFTEYFARRGFHVCIYDIKRKALKTSNNIRVADSIADCVKDADIVLVSVPLQITPKIIRQCVKIMKAGAVISEISSVKHRAIQALKNAPRNIRPLCIHPMFGPGASEKLPPKVLMVPVRNEDTELKTVHEMFENALVKVLPNAKVHDQSIGTVLGLTYFTNVVFARVISKGDITTLKQVAGTTFGLQSIIAESILTNELELVSALIQENPYAKKYIKQYLKEASAVAKMSFGNDGKKLVADLQKTRSKLQMQHDLQQSYKRMYNIIENLK